MCFLFKSAQTLAVPDKVGRKKFQRYAATQFGIFSQIDCAHTSFTQPRKNPVMGHSRAGFEASVFSQQLRRRLISRGVNKVVWLFVGFEERFDCPPQRLVSVGGSFEI